MVVGHVAPEAYDGGVIAFVKDGDSITIDAKKRLIQLNVPEREIARRRKSWKRPNQRYTAGVLAKIYQSGFHREPRRDYRLILRTTSAGVGTMPQSAAPVMSAMKGPVRLEICVGDITTLEVDAIVNATNRTLLGGGGVDGVHR